MSFNSGEGGGSSSIAGSSDVALSGVNDGQALVYNASGAKWRNGMVTTGSGFHRWQSGDPVPDPVLPGTYWIALGSADPVPSWATAGSLITRFVEG